LVKKVEHLELINKANPMDNPMGGWSILGISSK